MAEEFQFAALHNVKGGADDWEGPLYFSADGTFHREDGMIMGGASGTWAPDPKGKELILTWEGSDEEKLHTLDCGRSFRNVHGFTLTMTEGEPPDWFLDQFPAAKAWEDMHGNKYVDNWGHKIKVVHNEDNNTINFTHNRTEMTGTLDGQTLTVEGWEATGTVTEEGHVEFSDGGKWELKGKLLEKAKVRSYQEFAFDAEHDASGMFNDWKGELWFGSDKSFYRKTFFGKVGDTGTWKRRFVQSEEKTQIAIVLSWEDDEEETLITEDNGKSFANESLKLTLKEEVELPPWFASRFPTPKDPSCADKITLLCSMDESNANNSIFEDDEDEPEGMQAILQQAVYKARDIVEKVEEKFDDMKEAIEEAVDAVRDQVVDSLGLDDKFKSVADNTLDDVAPKAGDMCIEDAIQFIPGFQKMDDATSRDLDGEAKEACKDTILGFRGKIHDFCEDIVELLKEGFDMVGAALKCLYKVVSWILRACKEGVQMAIELLKKVIPDCCEPCCLNCFGLADKLAEWFQATFSKIVDMVEDFIKQALRSVGVPEFICEKVDFNGNSNADDAKDDDEPEKAKKAKARGEGPAEDAPDQVTM
jgi:hypothetical protein